MAKTVTLVRHAETNANVAGRWQGHADAGLSPNGLVQLAALAERVDGWHPDVLIASDLDRTMKTAAVIGDPVPNAQFREFDVGAWEGYTSEEIAERFPGQIEEFFAGKDVAPGAGEQMSVFGARVLGAFESLVDSLVDGQEAVVVTHGGVIWSILSHMLGGISAPTKMIPSHNTALTSIRIEPSGARVVDVFNDATHLTSVPTQFGPGGSLVSLYRHGQTEANLSGLWQGRSDSPLTELGRRQVLGASRNARPMNALYSSPMGRAQQTARIIGDAVDVDIEVEDGLAEMAFGSWEDVTSSEAMEHDQELFDRIFVHGEDLPRGGHGETFAQTGDRVAEAIARRSADDAEHIGAVSHGAAIRAYITRTLGLPFEQRNQLPIPRNSSLSQVRHTPAGPVLAAYNVAPHLDS